MYWTSLKKKTVSELWKYLQMNCALKYSLHFHVFWKMSLDYETDFVFGISLPCFCLSEIITVQIPWLCTRVFVYQKGWAPLRARIEIAHMELTLHHCKFRLWRVRNFWKHWPTGGVTCRFVPTCIHCHSPNYPTSPSDQVK